MFKTLKENILSTITAYPKLVTLGIGFVITLGVGVATGLIQGPHQAFAGGSRWLG